MEDVCLDTASRGLRGLGPPPGWWRRPAANVTRIILASIRPRAYHLSLKPVLWGHRRFAVIDKIHWASQLFEESGTVLAFAVLRNNGVWHFWALFPPRIFTQIWAMETSVLAIFSGPAKTPSIKHCSSRRPANPQSWGFVLKYAQPVLIPDTLIRVKIMRPLMAIMRSRANKMT